MALAASLHAALSEVGDPAFCVRSASTLFITPLPPGPATAHVRLLRKGRSVAHVAVSLTRNGSQPVLETIAVLGRDRAGFTFTDRVMPDVPAPDACPSFVEPPADGPAPPLPPFAVTPMWDVMERRVAIGHRCWERDWEPAGSFGAAWLRFRETPRDAHGAFTLLPALALTDMAGEAVSHQVGPNAPDWGMVSTDHCVHAFAPPQSEWLLLAFRANRGANGFVSVATEMWDQQGELVAVSTQVILLMLG